MKLLCELNDIILLGRDGHSSKPPRQTARAIVKNKDGLYAVMYAKKFGLHSLPGGGIENGEDALTALRREVYEETGCTCDDIQELGIVSENRASLDYTQINYYYVVTTADAPSENHLTDAEKSSHTIVEWHQLDKMIRLINEQEFDRIQQKYLQARDIVALREYQKYLLIGQYSDLCYQYNTDVEIVISHDIDRKLRIDGNRILLNENQIPDNELEGCIAYAVRQVLLPQMEIETPRLFLRPFRMSDSEDCFGFLCDREDCMNDGGYEPFAEMDEEYFALMEKFANQPLRKMIVRKDTGKVIGTVNIIEVNDRAVETYEIGYCISKVQQRKGYGYEAISTLCDCLLNTLHTDLLIAGVIEKNSASLRLLKKLGFVYEGRKTKGFWHPIDGAIDLLYFAKERTE